LTSHGNRKKSWMALQYADSLWRVNRHSPPLIPIAPLTAR
jgi:hypothetical protein